MAQKSPNAKSIDNPHGQTDWSTVFDDEPDDSLAGDAEISAEAEKKRQVQKAALAEAKAMPQEERDAQSLRGRRRRAAAQAWRNQAASASPSVVVEGGIKSRDLRRPVDPTDEPAVEAEAAVEMPPHMERYDRLEGGGLSYKPKGDPYEYTLSKEGTFTVINPATGAVEMTAPKDHPRYQAFVDHLMGQETEFTRGKAAPPAPPASDAAIDEEQASYNLDQEILGDLPEHSGFERPPLEGPRSPGSPESDASLDEILARDTEALESSPRAGEASVLDLLDEAFKRQRSEGVSAAPHVEETLGASDPELIGRLVKPSGLVNLVEVDRAIRNDELTLEDWQLIEGALKKQRVINPTSPQTTQRLLYASRDRSLPGR